MAIDRSLADDGLAPAGATEMYLDPDQSEGEIAKQALDDTVDDGHDTVPVEQDSVEDDQVSEDVIEENDVSEGQEAEPIENDKVDEDEQFVCTSSVEMFYSIINVSKLHVLC